MGQQYAFQLCFPRGHASDVLRATAAFAEPVGERRVALPDGERLVLPFTVGLESGETTVETGRWTMFDTSLWLPMDGAVRGYLDETAADLRAAGDEGWTARLRQGDSGEEAAIGYVYLTVGLGVRYALFTFSAATSNMSRLFYASEAVRGRFARLLEAHGGLRGLLDLEWSLFPLLTARGAYVLLDEGVLREAGPDGWVEAALAAPVHTG